MKNTLRARVKFTAPGDCIENIWAYVMSWCCNWKHADVAKMAGTGWQA